MRSTSVQARPYRLLGDPIRWIISEPPTSTTDAGRVPMYMSRWLMFGMMLSLAGCAEAQFCGYSGAYVYRCNNASQTSMPSTFIYLVTIVNMYDNEITSIPVGAFQGLTGLYDLRLSGNQVTSIPEGVFQGLTALRTLYLHENQITSIPISAFQGLTALDDLSLYENQITSIPAGAFQGLTALVFLRLHENQITSIPVDVFEGLTAIQTISFSANKINCIPEIVRRTTCTGCLSGLELSLYQNEQFYMCSSTPSSTSSTSMTPTFSPTFSPTVAPTSVPSFGMIPIQPNRNEKSASSGLYIIVASVVVVIILITVIAVILCRKARTPTQSSTAPETNNHITSNPTYATIEGTYSEIDSNHSGYETPMAYNPSYATKYETPMTQNPAYATRTSVMDAGPQVKAQPYAILEASHRTYETTSQQPQYDLATTMTSQQGFGTDSPYNEVVEMSIGKSDTKNSFA